MSDRDAFIASLQALDLSEPVREQLVAIRDDVEGAYRADRSRLVAELAELQEKHVASIEVFERNVREVHAELEQAKRERDEWQRKRTDAVAFRIDMTNERDSAIQRAEAELDKWNHCCVCIECGRCAIDEDGCCATCGRDALLLESGRLINRDFADNTEAVIRRDTASAIASWLESEDIDDGIGIDTLSVRRHPDRASRADCNGPRMHVLERVRQMRRMALPRP